MSCISAAVSYAACGLGLAADDGHARATEVMIRAGSIKRVERSCLALFLIAGTATWASGIAAFGYHHDEVMRAHSAWLAAQRLRS